MGLGRWVNYRLSPFVVLFECPHELTIHCLLSISRDIIAVSTASHKTPLIETVRYLNTLTLLVGFQQRSVLMSTPLLLLSADKPTTQWADATTGKLVKQIHCTNRRGWFGKWLRAFNFWLPVCLRRGKGSGEAVSLSTTCCLTLPHRFFLF